LFFVQEFSTGYKIIIPKLKTVKVKDCWDKTLIHKSPALIITINLLNYLYYMKIICTQENLKSGLFTVGRIISSSNTLPVLNSVHMKTENGLLKISSTNLEIAITTNIRCKVEEDGGFTVFCKTVNDLVSNLPNKNISLHSEAGEVVIETENYKTSIKTLPSEDFPIIPDIEKGETFSIDAQKFKQALEQVVFASASNQTQPEIAGVLLNREQGVLKIAATDRYRLAEKTITLDKAGSGSQAIIVPQKTLVELQRIIGSQSGNVEFTVNETQAVFEFNETKVISRLIDGQYPDYTQIIPTSFNTTVVTKKQELVSALKAGAIFSQNNNSVKFSFDPTTQKLVLSTESQDLGKSVVEIPSQVEGQAGGLVLNHHYLLDCLSNIGTENVVIKIVDDNSPSLMLPENQNDYLYLVMPIKI